MDIKEICKQTVEIVRETGVYILNQHRNREDISIEEKGTHNFVTEVDKTAESMLVDKLSNLLPEAGFIAEEGTRTNKGETYNWIIDPLDGTTNFIHGVFPFAISIGLTENDKPIIGVILELGLDECFYAWKGGGAWKDGQHIEVSQRKTLHESLIATGFPYTNFSSMRPFMETVDWFMKNSQGLRRLGSAATDIAYVACGRYDGFYEYGLNPWDVAAGIIILEEAGGKSADFSGGDNYIFGEELICSNGLNHQEFIDVIKSIMQKND